MAARMTIRDLMEIYDIRYEDGDNIFSMLRDYILDSRLSRDILNDKILLDLGDRESFYNHTETLKKAIDNFFRTHEYNIKKLCDTLELEYDPIRDIDYHEEEDIADNTGKEQLEQKRKQLNSGISQRQSEDSEDSTDDTNTTTETNDISASNVSTYQPRDKVTTVYTGNTESVSSKDTTTDTIQNDTTTESNSETEETDYTRDRNVHIYGLKNGNTYQDLIKKERDIAQFNIYQWIIDKLEEKICLQIWF